MKVPLRLRLPASLTALAGFALVVKKYAVGSLPSQSSPAEVAAITMTTPLLEVTSSQSPSPSPSQEARREATLLSVAATPSEITQEATCGDWASWIPPRTDPAVVMQLVSEPYADLQRNFIRLMELNSAITRQHLFLMCLDDASVPIFAALGIRCVPLAALRLHSHRDLWKTRVRVVSCLVAEGYDAIMSDSDALWLGDPMKYLSLSISSSVIASRGRYPREIGMKWGTTICMGFIMFRATGAAMDIFQDTMERIVLETGDDQVAVNTAALELGIVWDTSSDMRYESSTGVAKGTIAGLAGDDGEPFEITLLPHDKFTRVCTATPISSDTTVAHCYCGPKETGVKEAWMRDAHLWSPDCSSGSSGSSGGSSTTTNSTSTSNNNNSSGSP